MQVKQIYSDILGRIGVDLPNDRITTDDIFSTIFESAGQVRQQYFINGVVAPFAVTKKVETFSDDDNYAFLRKAVMSPPLYKSMPVYVGVLTSFVAVTSNVIETQIASWDQDVIARKDDRLYRAVTDISSENSYDKTFDRDKLRHFKPGNGAKFFVGDAFFSKEKDAFYHVDQSFTNSQGTTVDELISNGDVSEVYWMDVGPAYVEANLVNISNLSGFRYIDAKGGPVPITIESDTLYIPKDSGDSVILTYIPELQRVTSFTDELVLPEFAAGQVVTLALQKIAYSLGVTIPETPTPESEQTDDNESESQ